MGAVTTSATLGGTFVVDARYVRLIPYDTGSGNVPAYNTTVSQGSASGLLIGVYSALNVAPTTPGSAMPASGYVKVKQWNSVAYAAGALTGIGANATGADVAGWIEVVGNENAASSGVITFNGLGNPATPHFRGEWYYIGTTPGSPARTDTYQIPTNGNTCYMPGVWVETAAGSGEYEFYYTTSSTALLANVATDTRRGRYCWISTAGVLRFGHDGTNLTGGYVPAAGCKIRTGNIFLTMAPTASPTVNSLHATQANRYRFGGSTLSTLTMDKTTCNWYVVLTSYGKITLTDSSYIIPTVITQAGQEVEATRCGWGSPIAITHTGAVETVQCAQGFTLTDCYISYGAFGASGRNILRSNISKTLTLTRCDFGFTGTRSASSNFGLTLLFAPDVTVTDCVIAGTVNHSSGAGVTFTGNNEFWFDHTALVTTATNIGYLFATSSSTDVLIEDITFPIAGQLPRSGLISMSNSSTNTVRNIGSYDTPYDFRLYNEENATWSRVSTLVTVTTASPHGMSTGHRCVPYVSSNISAITLAGKDITVTGANTFEFTGVNTGTTSGTLSFYGSCASTSTFISVGSTNAEGVKIHNVHFKGVSAATWIIDTTSIDTELKNVSFDPDYSFQPGAIGTGTITRSILVADEPSSASATLGTHFSDNFLRVEGGATDKTAINWTRASAIVTVASPNHGLRVGDYIQVYDSTNPAGVLETHQVMTTVPDKDTFTLTGANTGTTSGTLSYRVREGIFHVHMNGTTVNTADQAVVTSGAPAFTGASTLAAFSVGDQIVFETPDFILGHDSFPVMWPQLPSSGGSPRNNCDIDYQIDRGAGYSGWRNMHVKRSTCSGTSGSTSITVDTTTGLAVDDYVWMASGVLGVAAEAKIVSIDSGTTLTLSAVNRTTFSAATLSFGYHPNETTFPATGARFKFRLTVLVAFANAATNLEISTRTTTTSRNYLYAQDVDTVSFTISGLPTGTTVALYDNTDTELQREDNILTGSFVYDYVHSGIDFTDNYYVIWHEDYVPYKSDLFDLTATDLGLSYTPVDDPIYDAASDDRYTINFVSKLIIMDTGETSYDVPGAYSQWKDDIFLADNFIYDFAFTIKGGVDYATPKAIPAFTALINGWKIRPDEADHTLIVENGILYVEGGGDPFVDTVGAYTVRINYSQPVEVLLVSTGSGVLPTDITDIAEAVWTNTDTNTGTQKGKLLKDAAGDSEFSAYAK